jgi:predicted RNase H-like HicB family nuclease
LAGFILTKPITYVTFITEVKDMPEYLIPISIEYLEEGQYLATSSVLQGLIAQGRTIAETIEIAEDVARKIIESCIEHGDRLPKNLTVGQRPHFKLNVKIPVPVEK